MGIGIIDIATSTIRAVDKTIQTMHAIQLVDIPLIRKEPIMSPRILSPENSITTLIKLKHPESYGTGFVITYLRKEVAAKLLEDSGLEGELSEEKINDACEKLCNQIAETFKAEISGLGHGEIFISTPKVYTENVNEVIDGVDVDEKYEMNFTYSEKSLLTVDIAFQMKQDK